MYIYLPTGPVNFAEKDAFIIKKRPIIFIIFDLISNMT